MPVRQALAVGDVKLDVFRLWILISLIRLQNHHSGVNMIGWTVKMKWDSENCETHICLN